MKLLILAMLLAFDPGKNIGVALIDQKQVLIAHSIISLDDLLTYEIEKNASIIVGNGTGSKAVEAILKERHLSFELVDETGTSLEARSLYFNDNPPQGLMRLLPASLRSPPDLIDDYAAYAIALRYLKVQ